MGIEINYPKKEGKNLPEQANLLILSNKKSISSLFSVLFILLISLFLDHNKVRDECAFLKLWNWLKVFFLKANATQILGKFGILGSCLIDFIIKWNQNETEKGRDK